MKTIFILFALIVSFSLKAQSIEELRTQKSVYDSTRIAHKKAQLVVVRTSGKELIKIKNRNWPENIETTYNILIQNSQILMIGIYPYSESSDWSIAYQYYFSESGNTFCYELKAATFNSTCTEILRRTHSTYFDSTSQKIRFEYKYKW